MDGVVGVVGVGYSSRRTKNECKQFSVEINSYTDMVVEGNTSGQVKSSDWDALLLRSEKLVQQVRRFSDSVATRKKEILSSRSLSPHSPTTNPSRDL
jgi:hypothetical protein